MTRYFVFALILGLATGTAMGQESRSTSGDRIEGKVQKVDRDNSTIYVTYDSKTRQVLYDKTTRFTVLNQPGTLEAVKEGRPVICRGRFDWRNRLAASRVDVQEKGKEK